MIPSIKRSNLNELDVNGWKKEEQIVNELKWNAKKVNSVVFKECEITPKIIKALGKCINLQAIHFDDCSTLSNLQVAEIIKKVKNSLREFQVTGTAKLTDAVWNTLLPSIHLKSIKLLTSLPNTGNSQGFYEFLKQNQGIIENLNVTAFYSEDPMAYGLRFPNLKTFTWCAIVGESIKILKEHSPNLTFLDSCTEPTVYSTPFCELFQGFKHLKSIKVFQGWVNLKGLNDWKSEGLKNLSLFKCGDVNQKGAPLTLDQLNTFEKNNKLTLNFTEAKSIQGRLKTQAVTPLFTSETTQLSAPSITEDGICYFLSGEKLIECNLITGKQEVKNPTLNGMTETFGSQCSANGNYAISAPSPQKNGSTEVSVVCLETNESIFNERIETNFLLSDLEILRYKKESLPWFTAVRLNANDLTPMFLKIFSLEKKYNSQSILFPLGYALAGTYPPSCNFTAMLDESTVALLAFSGDMMKKHPVSVFYVDLKEAKITRTFDLPPINNDEVSPLVSAITAGPECPYPLAVLTPKGKVFYGPIEDKIDQSFDLGKQVGRNYGAFTFIDKNRLAFFARDGQSSIPQYIIGFYDLKEGHTLQITLNDLPFRSNRGHVAHMKMLNNGKLAVAINTQGLSSKNENPSARMYLIDVPNA